MKSSITTRITALTAALALIAGSAASCGKKGDSSETASKTAKELMSASYKAVEVVTDVENVAQIYRIDENRLLLTEAEEEKKTPTFYITDNDFAATEPIEVKIDVKDNEEVYYNYTLSPDGDIVVLATFTDFGDMEKPNFDDPDFDYDKFNFEEYQKNIKTTYKLYTVDLEGNIKSQNEITGFEEYSDEDGDVHIGNMYPCGNGKVICELYTMDSNYVIVESDGKISGKLEGLDENYIDSVAVIDDDTLAAAGYFKNYESSVKLIDAATLKAKDEVIDLKKAGLADNMGTIFKGSGDYRIFMSTSSGLFGIKEDGSGEEIINWLDSDLGDGGVNSIVAMDNGDYIISYMDYSSPAGGTAIYRLTKRDVSELENMKVVTIGVMYDAWDVKQKVSAFNKAHDDVRFKMVDYSKYNDYDHENEKMISSAGEQLKKDIISGNAPDMIVCDNQAIIKNLANKGLFLDLNEYLAKDNEIKTEDIMPNVLSACEIGGKLLSIPTAFNVQTYAIKSKNYDKEGWTIDDMIDIYNKMPEGSSLTMLDCKESISSMILGAMCSCIDYEKRTCSFDSPEFKKILDFANKFPKQDELIDWDDQDAVMKMYNNDNFMKDKQLLEEVYIYDFESYISQFKGRFGDEPVTFVGSPSVGGNGGMLQLSESLSILTNSENKDACWELIKEFFKAPEEDEEDGERMYMSGLSTIKSRFEKAAEAATKKPYYIDENGKRVEYNYTYYDQTKNKPIDIAPLTEDEKNKLVDYIMNCTTIVDNFDPDIENIIHDEADAFFEGEKTADEIISNLQNRISLLLSEQG